MTRVLVVGAGLHPGDKRPELAHHLGLAHERRSWTADDFEHDAVRIGAVEDCVAGAQEVMVISPGFVADCLELKRPSWSI